MSTVIETFRVSSVTERAERVYTLDGRSHAFIPTEKIVEMEGAGGTAISIDWTFRSDPLPELGSTWKLVENT